MWHLTHRCHKGDFLLKFGRDRSRWLSWLFEARKRHGLSTILNYVVISNHIHLLVYAGEVAALPLVAPDPVGRALPSAVALLVACCWYACER